MMFAVGRGGGAYSQNSLEAGTILSRGELEEGDDPGHKPQGP